MDDTAIRNDSADDLMAARIQRHDWAATPLGPADRWPASLRAAVGMALANGFPMIVLWGPELAQVYNDGYRALMGIKHPAGLGQPNRDCWPEVWHLNAPIFERVRGGETVTLEDALFPIARSGRLEDAWFTVSYSPLRDGSDAVAGVLVTAIETTGRLLAERRHDIAEAALRESERRFRALVTATADVVYRMSPDWNEMLRLSGSGLLADTDEPRRDWLETYIPAAERPRVLDAVGTAIRDASLFALEHRVIRADGSIGWAFSRAVPMRDAQGTVLEWFGAASDVTARRVAVDALDADQVRRVFLLSLSDAIRPIADPLEIQRVAMRALGEHLAVSRAFCFTAEREAGGWVCGVESDDFRRSGVDPLIGRLPQQAFGRSVLADLERGRPVAVDDVSALAGLTPVERLACGALDVAAFVAVPLIKVGQMAGGVCVHQSTPRRWSEAEIALVGDVAERTWAAVERARVQAALRESEALFAQFARHASDVLWIVDARTHRLEYLSPSYEVVWGEARTRVTADLGRWAATVHPHDRERVRGGLARLIEGERLIQEYRIVRPDGAVRWIHDTGFPIDDGAGRIVRVAGIAQDLTERKRIEERMRASETRLRNVTEGIPELVWTAVDGGHWTWASPQWCDFTGRDEPDSHGWGWLAAVAPDDHEAARAAWRQARTRGSLDFHARIRHAASGRLVWFQFRATPTRNAAGAIIEWLGTCSDIDANKQLQSALQEADTRKDEFLAMLAHELRNPLVPVRNAMKLMEREPLTERGRSAADMCRRQIHHLGRLVDDLLEVSRVTRGKIRLRRETVLLQTLVRDAVAPLAPILEARRQQLGWHLPDEPVETVVDPVRIAQVVENLLTNASKYTDVGGRIGIRIEVQHAEVLLAVSDTGIGVDPAALPRLFELFTQLEPTHERSGGGLGIGLALVKQLVGLHGGRVAAHSDGRGQGSTFCVWLPLGVVDAA